MGTVLLCIQKSTNFLITFLNSHQKFSPETRSYLLVQLIQLSHLASPELLWSKRHFAQIVQIRRFQRQSNRCSHTLFSASILLNGANRFCSLFGERLLGSQLLPLKTGCSSVKSQLLHTQQWYPAVAQGQLLMQSLKRIVSVDFKLVETILQMHLEKTKKKKKKNDREKRSSFLDYDAIHRPVCFICDAVLVKHLIAVSLQNNWLSRKKSQ